MPSAHSFSSPILFASASSSSFLLLIFHSAFAAISPPPSHSSSSFPLQFSIDNLPPSSPEDLAKIFAKCPNKSGRSAVNGGFLCDPNGILTQKERHSLKQRMEIFQTETLGTGGGGRGGNQHKKEAKCHLKGITVGILLSHWAISAVPNNINTPGRQMNVVEHLAHKLALDPECQQFILLLVPVYELGQMSILHGAGVPLRGEQLHFVVEMEKPLLQQGHYFEALEAILDGVHLLLMQEAQFANPPAFYRLEIEQQRGEEEPMTGNDEMEDEDEEWKEYDLSRRKQQEEKELLKKMEKRRQEEKQMTQSFLALIASCAVLFSLLLSVMAFGLFYYISIVRDGGMSCWNKSGSYEPEKSCGGVYYVKEISMEGTTVLEDLAGVP